MSASFDLDGLIDVIAERVAEKLRATTDSDPYVPHSAWGLVGKPSRHAAQLPTARRRGRTWFARRSDLARYIEEGARSTSPALPPKGDAIDRELASLGFGGPR